MRESRIPRRWRHTNNLRYAGVHIIADFWFAKNITSTQKLKRLLLKAAKKAQSAPLELLVHKFSPQGLTGVLLIAESHLAIHTWPEIGYTALDIFTCGKNVKPREALAFLKEELKPKKVFVKELQRGTVRR